MIVDTDVFGTDGRTKSELLLAETQTLYLAHDIEDTGIQEKYLKRQLTAQEPLTDLDIKRFLANTGMAEHVHFAKLDTKDIGHILHQERTKQAGKSAPYSIPLIINAGSEGSPPYAQWLSLVVTVNPISANFSFKVNAGYKLNDLQKSQIAKTIENAIRFEEPDKSIQAFPGATAIANEIKTHHSGKLCGYKALHELYKEVALRDAVADNESATIFQAKSDIQDIKQVVYDVQLKTISLTPAQHAILSPQIAMNFSLGKIKDDELGKQLSFFPTPTAGIAVQHSIVLERISELQIYHKKIRFPGLIAVPPLTSNDYEQFLLLTAEKFKSSGTKKVLNEMVISCNNDAALIGLTAYNGTHQPLPFHTLTLDLAGLDLSSPHAKERFLFHLQTTLLSMSENNLSALTFINNNNQLTAQMIKDLATFITDRKIAVDVTLPPEFQTSASQKEIDEAVSDNIRKKNIAALGIVATKDDEMSKRVGEVRKRPKLSGKQDLSVDVELQEEQQVEVAVETSAATSAGTGQPEATHAVIYSMFEFASRINSIEGSGKKLVSGSNEECYHLWRLWTGALSDTEAALGIKMSKSACEELFRYSDKFQYGLDLKNLPPGFMYKTDGATTYIHFDDNYKQFSVYNPLQVQTTTLESEKPLTSVLFNKWLKAEDASNPIRHAWERLNSAPYNKVTSQLFKQLLPQMLLLDKEELNRLFELCFNTDHSLNANKFKFLMEDSGKLKLLLSTTPKHDNLLSTLGSLFAGDAAKALAFINLYEAKKPDFEHHLLRQLIGEDKTAQDKVKEIIKALPDVNLNALLQLYIELGEKGLDELTTLVGKYPLILPQLNTHVFSHTKTYASLFTEEYKNAIIAINALSPEEKAWWDVLLTQHCEAQTDVNLVDMVNAFKEFKKELTVLGLAFPPHCELKGVKSLPIALSRMLHLLKHCKEENRPTQWAEVSKLDLSGTGMIKPISMRTAKEWAFISAEMNINSSRIEPYNTSYVVPDRWRAIFEGTPERLFENFFRFVAYQETNGQLPLDFYKHTHKQITDSGLSSEVQLLLYPIIATVTTTPENVSTIKSLDSAVTDVNHLIKLLVDTPIPGITPAFIKENVRINLLNFLFALNALPALPGLNKLVSMISTSVNSVPKLFSNGPRLLRAADELNIQTYRIGSRVFEGMKNYTDDDYKDSELFFNYLQLVKKIGDTLLTAPASSHEGYKNLVGILSTFKVKLADIDAIISAHFTGSSDLYNERRNEALNLCRSLSMSNSSTLGPLTTTDLMTILAAVKDSSVPVVEVFKNLRLSGGQSLAAYFPKDLLEHYGKAGIPDAVEAMIRENFSSEPQRSHIRRILLRFSAPGDALQYGKIIEKIIAISKPKDEIEKTLFITKLATAEGLYTNLQRLDQEGNYFLGLLDTIISKKSTDEFLTLLAAERQMLRNSSPEQVGDFFVQQEGKGASVAGLSKKAALYMQTLSPAIREIEHLAISDVDLVPRVQETLLRTPISQLDVISTVVINDNDEFYTHQETALADLLKQIDEKRPVDFNSVNEATDAFIANTSAADHASNDKYSKIIKPLKTPTVDSTARNRALANPAMQSLLQYIINPDSPPAPSYLQKLYIDYIVERTPSLKTKKELITSLMATPACWQSMAQASTLSAAMAPDMLDNPGNLNLVLSSLAKDLDTFDNMRQETKRLHAEVSTQRAKLNGYPSVFVNLYKKINAIAIENPGSKKQFLELYDRYLQHYSLTKHGELLKYLSDFVGTLEKSFAKTTDKNNVLSLCLQFNSDTDKELQPEGLIKLLKAVESVPVAHQATVLNIAVVLINNEKGYTLEGFTRLCELATTNSAFASTLASTYRKAPFPTMDLVLEWHGRAVESGDYDIAMNNAYKAYNKAPCHRELEHNGFHEDKAAEQLRAFTGFEASQIDLRAFAAKTAQMREKSTDELLAIFNKFNPKKPAEYDAAFANDYDTLVAVAAELFHRSKGKDEKHPGGEFVMGSSMEINTTQYLAILSSLKTPGHVTSQIGTGEGKSRIMMISIACQIAQGKTVDFVTSDAQLATRDFVEYQAYFEMVDAKTSMIFANTDPSLYQVGGVNFSDPSNISLFRNKARSMGRGAEVIDPVATNRALLLDEADKTYFDVADTRFNFSQEGDETIRGMEWVYPLLMKYFAQEKVNLSVPINDKMSISPSDLYYEDVDLSRENFLQFATKECSQQQLLRLRALSNAQIEQWQVSAVTASQLKFKDDFVIDPDTLITTSSGPKISSEAQLLFSNRVSKNSKFSFGVHQFLHARLNLARQHLDDEKDAGLREALSKCEHAFYVPNEKQIVYSSTSKNLLDDYKDGTLKAVTGTYGSIIERQEAQELYGLATDKMRFINVPRDKGIHRNDHALRLTGNQAQQIDVLVAQIKEARAKHQPILIIAENDEESEFLFKKLSEVFKDDEKIQHIHSQLSLKDEKDRINKAGFPGQLTVSTDMIGRGTDISLRGESKTHGLNVMVTYLPKTRDLEQIVGRSGRFGAKGDTSLILDKKRLRAALNKAKLGDAFYSNVESFVLHEQALMDRRSQCERLIKITVGDFRKVLTDVFFENMLKNTNKEHYKKLLPSWTTFFDKSDKTWNEQWPHIQKELAASPIDVAKVEALLNEYRSNVQKMWDTVRRNIQDVDVLCIDGSKPIEKLVTEVPPLILTKTAKSLLAKSILVEYKEEVYDRFDPGHEGRAVKYSDPSIPRIATLKGYANLFGAHYSDAKRPFANFQAWREGRGKLFPELRARAHRASASSSATEETEIIATGAGASAAPTASALPPEPEIYTTEKASLALGRLRHEGAISDKPLLSDAQWMTITAKLRDVIEDYKTKGNYDSKSAKKKEHLSQLEDILHGLKNLGVRGERNSVLQDSITRLMSIERDLKDGLIKKSVLKQKIQEIITFYSETLSTAVVGVDPTELAEAIFNDENKRLGEWSRYPALHDLNASWWEDLHLETIKKLPPELLTESTVDFLNTMEPAALDSHLLKALQTDGLDSSVDVTTLRIRGQFLLLLDTKPITDSLKASLRTLAQPWWNHPRLEKLLALPPDLLRPSVITFLNTVSPDKIDDAVLNGLRYRQAVGTLETEPLTTDLLQYAGKQKELLGPLSESHPVLHDLVAIWWSPERVEILKQLPEMYYTKEGVSFLNTIDPAEVDSNILKALQTDELRFDEPVDVTALRTRGQFLLLLDTKPIADSLKASLMTLAQPWWNQPQLDKLLALPPDLLRPSVITFLNTVSPDEIDDTVLNGLRYMHENGRLEEHLTIALLRHEGVPKVTPVTRAESTLIASAAPSLSQTGETHPPELTLTATASSLLSQTGDKKPGVSSDIRHQIELTGRDYKKHVSKQRDFFGLRAGFYKNQIVQLKIGEALNAADLHTARAILESAKTQIESKYGRQSISWSWFSITKTTSKSIVLLENLINVIDASIHSSEPATNTGPIKK